MSSESHNDKFDTNSYNKFRCKEYDIFNLSSSALF